MKFMLKCLRSCPSKIIESGTVVIYAAHYTCSNVDLNLILVSARTTGFIFQIIDSLMASRQSRGGDDKMRSPIPWSTRAAIKF